MLALQGYFDGNEVRTLEQIQAKKNQKLIITILDEFIDCILYAYHKVKGYEIKTFDKKLKRLLQSEA